MNKAPRVIEVILEHQSSPDNEERLFAAFEMIFAHFDRGPLDGSESPVDNPVDKAI